MWCRRWATSDLAQATPGGSGAKVGGTEMEQVELSGTRGEHMSSRGAKTPMTLCEKTHNKSSRCPRRPLTLETNLGKVRFSDENKETRTFPTSLFGSRGYDFSNGIKTFGSDEVEMSDDRLFNILRA